MGRILPDECLDKYPIAGVRSGSESNPDLHLKSRGPVLLNYHALSNRKSSLRSVNGGTNRAHGGTHLKAELSGTGSHERCKTSIYLVRVHRPGPDLKTCYIRPPPKFASVPDSSPTPLITHGPDLA